MDLRENVDYRLDHEKKILYMPERLRNASYQDKEVQRFTGRWAEKGYRVSHGYTDKFIETGKINSPFYRTPYTL